MMVIVMMMSYNVAAADVQQLRVKQHRTRRRWR